MKADAVEVTAARTDESARATRAALAIAPGVLLAGVAGGIAFPILPAVGMQAGLPLTFIGVILAANRATRVVASPVVGAIADRFGGRRTLVAGLFIQMAVMLLYTLGVTTGHPGWYFLVGRMLHGPGSACVFVAAQALALHAGGEVHGGRAAATVRVAMALGVPLGLAVGGVLSDRWGDAPTFEAALAAVVFAALAAWWLVPDIGVALKKPTPWRELARAMADRRLLAIGSLNFAVSFSVMGMVLTTLAMVVRVRGVSILGLKDQGTSGLLLGVMIVTSALAMPLAGRFGDRWRAHARIALAGLVALVPSLVVVAVAPGAGGLIVGLVLMGIAGGAFGPSLLALVGDVVAPERRGTGVGVLQLCGDFGGTLGPLFGTALFAGSFRTPYLFTAALLVGFVPFAAWLALRVHR